MRNQNLLENYLTICCTNLKKNKRIITFLKNQGIYENYIFENFCIGYSNGMLIDLVGENEELKKKLAEIEIIKSGKEMFKNYITIPIFNENKAFINIIGYNIYPKVKTGSFLLMMSEYSTSHF